MVRERLRAHYGFTCVTSRTVIETPFELHSEMVSPTTNRDRLLFSKWQPEIGYYSSIGVEL
jgi:hypothetical protein